MRTISVEPYDKAWREKFEAEKTLLTRTILIKNLIVHHIGSTSVEGLAAKPIIDILLEVESVEELDQYDQGFDSMGYECKGEFGIAGRRYFQKGGDDRTYQIHAFNADSSGAKRHLAFRDYLIAHQDVAAEYQALKYKAASECNNDIEVYCDIKNDFIVHHEMLAVKWSEVI